MGEATCPTDPLCCFPCALAVNILDDHGGAALCQQQGVLPAHASACASDHGDAILQIAHSAYLFAILFKGIPPLSLP